MFRCHIIDLIKIYKKLNEIIDYKNNIKLNLIYDIYYKFDSRLILETKIIIFLLVFSDMIVSCFWLH